jgi:uncharacterized protein
LERLEPEIRSASLPPLQPLAPAQRRLLRQFAALTALPFFLIAAFADAVLLPDAGLPSLAGLIVLAVAAPNVLILSDRRYRAWGYALTDEEIHVARGLWTRTHTIIPLARVEHIDVAQGPLQRRHGIGTLVLHTAGTANSSVSLPGLELAEAERLRDEVRGRIREGGA